MVPWTKDFSLLLWFWNNFYWWFKMLHLGFHYFKWPTKYSLMECNLFSCNFPNYSPKDSEFMALRHFVSSKTVKIVFKLPKIFNQYIEWRKVLNKLCIFLNEDINLFCENKSFVAWELTSAVPKCAHIINFS